MAKISFSIESSLSHAWTKFQENSVFWIGITIFSLGLGIPGNMMPPSYSALLTLLSTYFSASITLMTIKYMRGESVSLHDLLAINFITFIHYIFAVIISTVAIVLGFICFIFPGFYIMVRLMLTSYLILDKHISFDRAIKESWKMTKGNEFNLLAFIFAMFIIIVVGFLALFFGLLIAIPVTQLCTATIYLTFCNHSIDSNDETSSDISEIEYE